MARTSNPSSDNITVGKFSEIPPATRRRSENRKPSALASPELLKARSLQPGQVMKIAVPGNDAESLQEAYNRMRARLTRKGALSYVPTIRQDIENHTINVYCPKAS